VSDVRGVDHKVAARTKSNCLLPQSLVAVSSLSRGAGQFGVGHAKDEQSLATMARPNFCRRE
jgi:hypothetical protein